jgi:NhaP-type Na+/H+ or K+/H+ antiporter
MPFNMFIVVFFVGGWGAGRLAAKAALPSIFGMVLFGIGIAFFLPQQIPPLLQDLDPFLKSLALVVILLRAGLGIRRSTLIKVGRAAIPMAFIPCLTEAAVLTAAYHLLFGLPLITAALGAFMLSAVSPAVVVPSMLELKERGLGKKNEVPTIVLAGASVDDVVAITFFSLFLMLAGKDKGTGGEAASLSALEAAASPLIGGDSKTTGFTGGRLFPSPLSAESPSGLPRACCSRPGSAGIMSGSGQPKRPSFF